MILLQPRIALSQSLPLNPDVHLKLGQPSPYEGVLSDESKYRDRIEAVRLLKDININPKEYLDPKPQDLPQIKLFSSGGVLITISVGISLGVLGYFLGHEGH